MMPQGSTFTTRPQLAGTFGMVTSTHWLASTAGMAVLEKGGNAFDAAVAAGLVLQVVEPHLNGPGGEVPIIGYDAAQGEAFVLDGQGPAPQAATVAAFEALGLDLVPGSGLLAACVPAAFGTWMLLLAAHGWLRLREVMEYAIGYARDGYPVVHGLSAGIASVADASREHWPSSAEIYLAGGVPAPGTRLANPVLAATYQRLLDEAEAAGPGREAQIEAARRAFYQGFVAEAIGKYTERAEVMDVTGERHRALLAPGDLARWRASAEPPITAEYQGLTVCKTGPWGQGPVFLQQLALLAGFDLAAMEPGGAEYIHTVVECAKLAFADREAWYGDPRFADVPLAALLSADYAARRRELVGPAASPDLRPGRPAGAEPRLPGYATGVTATLAVTDGWAGDPVTDLTRPGLAGAQHSRDTCHVDAADRFGNVVAATPSGGWLQSSPVIPGLGFCLGTRGQMFWLEEGLPTSLKPGTRPRTTLTPSMATGPNGEILAFGSPGGDSQDQWICQFFLRVIDGKRNLQEAIDTPQFQTDHHPNSFYPRKANPLKLLVEDRIGAATIDALKQRGHEVEA